MGTPVFIRLLFFGPLREKMGSSGERRRITAGTSVGDLMETLREEGVVAEQMVSAVAVAVNQEYVRSDRVLLDGDEVAILPPVSGGAR